MKIVSIETKILHFEVKNPVKDALHTYDAEEKQYYLK